MVNFVEGILKRDFYENARYTLVIVLTALIVLASFFVNWSEPW